jgi:acetyl-CoA carboxylase carboxyl transferase subunit alpha
MNLDYLDFEQPIAKLQEQVEALRRAGSSTEINITEEIARLNEKIDELTESVFENLSAKQVVQLARHPLRPYTQDYIERMLTDFYELHGDRHQDQAMAIMGGLARLDGQSVMVIGHQKGRGTTEKLLRNFGMASPEGFRKALRLMKMAEQFRIPVITLIDTPGAYPGIEAEERNQSEAIARNLLEMSRLRVPILCAVIGEGCSGGALALGVGDCTLMLQYAYYSVISPEGCATILWRSAERAAEAAEALNLTAERLHSLGLIDTIVEEPLGGAHRDRDAIANSLKNHLKRELRSLEAMSMDELLERRYQRWMQYGRASGDK